jgi:hypothetical protein
MKSRNKFKFSINYRIISLEKDKLISRIIIEVIFLKKSLVSTLFILLITISMPLNINVFSAPINMKDVLINHYKAPEHSREELNQDIFMTLLLPSIQNRWIITTKNI